MRKAQFEWDPAKDKANRQKHGVSFVNAQYAFADPRRVIARDVEHSETEERFYCFGEMGGGILTVRFTCRRGPSSEFSAPATGARARRSMSKKIEYTNEPLGRVEVIPDTLPSPEELAFREEGVKVTLALSKRTIDFFKLEASRHHTPYQRMIRRLLDSYVDSQQDHTKQGLLPPRETKKKRGSR